MNIGQFLEQNMANFFCTPIVSIGLFLEQISLKEQHEKDQFFTQVETSFERIPVDFLKHKILPELIKALEFGGAGVKALQPILKISSKLNDEEFEKTALPAIVKLVASPDRNIRIVLCENIGQFIEKVIA